MGEKHTVRFEPVGIEMEVDEDETILDGAFRQGLMLMHGCKEGQCAACKSFLLEGEVELGRYSTFALPDFDEAEGWTLLCRAHALTDLEVELVNYDEEVLRSGVALQTARTRIEAIDRLTHDIRHLRLSLIEPQEFVFHAGQYVDIKIPGTDEHRSFSMASTPSNGHELEFMIKLYPKGCFSGLLRHELKVGDELEISGPYGVFTLRESSERRLVFVGGGAGMAPILALLRSLAEQGSQRPAVYYYGARRPEDLFHVEEVKALEKALPDFRFVPALSEVGAEEEGWTGEVGLITDVVARNEGDLGEVDVYLCGPPPMVDAAMPLMEEKGAEEAHIYYDKFTTSAPEE